MKIQENKHIILSLFHIILVVPLLLSVAFMKANTPNWLYKLFFILGAVITVYHGYKFMHRYIAHSPYMWVNAMHFLFIGPLLLYIGTQEKMTPRACYEILAITGFGALGYHLYSMVSELQIYSEEPRALN